jgi:deoxyribose-phosphate aldolase
MDPKELASKIDHTLLNPIATSKDIEKLCSEAKRYGFASVYVAPSYVSLASKLLKGTKVKVGTVVGFPLGFSSPKVKVLEAREALKDGASNIDMVINLSALKSGNYKLIKEEIKDVVNEVKKRGATVKVIIETCYLSQKEKIRACKLVVQAGADFVKTSTGFGLAGARAEDVKLIRKVVGKAVGIKASGGIRTAKKALAMIRAGADLIGTSSGVRIIEELKNLKA